MSLVNSGVRPDNQMWLECVCGATFTIAVLHAGDWMSPLWSAWSVEYTRWLSHHQHCGLAGGNTLTVRLGSENYHRVRFV